MSRRFVAQASAADGALFLFLRHTSASLAIQENADPDVQKDLMTALRRLAPEDAGWIHDTEGPDDMPGACEGDADRASDCMFQWFRARWHSGPGKASI